MRITAFPDRALAQELSDQETSVIHDSAIAAKIAATMTVGAPMASGPSDEMELMSRELSCTMSSVTPFTCVVCLDVVAACTGWIGNTDESCRHRICIVCARNHVASLIEQGRYPLPCAVCRLPYDHDKVLSLLSGTGENSRRFPTTGNPSRAHPAPSSLSV